MRRPSVRSLLLATAFALGASAALAVEGPQLRRPPQGMGLDLNCSAARLPVTSLAPVRQRCYVAPFRDPPDWITLTEYRGTLTADEIRSEHEAYVERWSNESETHSDLHEDEIEGRTAWYRYELADGRARGCTAFVSYDDATFSIEFDANTPTWQDERFMRETVLSFARDTPGRVAKPALALAAVGALVAVGVVMTRRRRAEQERERVAAEVRARYEAERAARPGPSSPPGGQRG